MPPRPMDPPGAPWKQQRISTALEYPARASEAVTLAETLGRSLERYRMGLEVFDWSPWELMGRLRRQAEACGRATDGLVRRHRKLSHQEGRRGAGLFHALQPQRWRRRLAGVGAGAMSREPPAGKESRLRGQRIHKNPPTKISQTDCAATEDKESQESGPCSARGVLAGVSRRYFLRRPGPVQGRCWLLGPMPSQLRDLSRVGGSGKKGWIPGIPLRRWGSGEETAVDPLGFIGLRCGFLPPPCITPALCVGSFLSPAGHTQAAAVPTARRSGWTPRTSQVALR
jgi:hypothetical protein